MGVKLNIGCGGRTIPGYIGVDAVKRPAAQVIAPAHRLPYAPGQVEEIMAIHLWEHFYLWECPDVIKEWRRVLQKKGRLVLELPNLRKCCENLLSGSVNAGKDPHQLSYWGLYGDPRQADPYMHHKWGWTPEDLTKFLLDNGFEDVVEMPTQWHPAGKELRDMRLEAVRA